MRNSLLTLLYLLIPTACSSIEELRGSDPSSIDRRKSRQYRADLDQCEDYADEVAIAREGRTGAVSGAVLALCSAPLSATVIQRRREPA